MGRVFVSRPLEVKVNKGLEFKIKEMAQRIKTLREIMGYSIEEMATKTGVTVEEFPAGR